RPAARGRFPQCRSAVDRLRHTGGLAATARAMAAPRLVAGAEHLPRVPAHPAAPGEPPAHRDAEVSCGDADPTGEPRRKRENVRSCTFVWCLRRCLARSARSPSPPGRYPVRLSRLRCHDSVVTTPLSRLRCHDSVVTTPLSRLR